MQIAEQHRLYKLFCIIAYSSQL